MMVGVMGQLGGDIVVGEGVAGHYSSWRRDCSVSSFCGVRAIVRLRADCSPFGLISRSLRELVSNRLRGSHLHTIL